MGAFIMLHLCRKFPENVHGVLAVAPAFNFLDQVRSWSRDVTSRNGYRQISSPYGQWEIPDCFFNSKILKENELDYDGLALPCYLSVFQGMKDEIVSWSSVLNCITLLNDKQVAVTLQKDGDHRLSRDEDIRLLLHLLHFIISNR